DYMIYRSLTCLLTQRSTFISTVPNIIERVLAVLCISYDWYYLWIIYVIFTLFMYFFAAQCKVKNRRHCSGMVKPGGYLQQLNSNVMSNALDRA
ncbi:hypothetical protein ALC57_08687, partial [Trachymyrmex cornetzi]